MLQKKGIFGILRAPICMSKIKLNGIHIVVIKEDKDTNNVKKHKGVGVLQRSNEEDFAKGLMWGTSLSIPLWIAIFGWVKLVAHVFSK